ncbi:hypothetical protein [Actinocorallia libanotica]|uniref:NAD(P)H-dependent amine dehydrogenase family protein n=1 Tax=Actinocorallia libanotica TaxID=46162 RepID=UPI0031D96145
MTLRVIQWATGGVGRAAIEMILKHPDLELVGCWVHSEDKHGRDVGEIIGTGPIGVVATGSVEEILALEADAVIYAPAFSRTREIAALLRSGKNVITPLNWFYPTPEDAARVRDACLEGGTTLHGTGVDPGGATDLHPLTFAALSSAVTFVRGEEFSDLRDYNTPEVLRDVMGFGHTPEHVRESPILERIGHGYTQSVRMCLDALGFADAEIRPSLELAMATAPIACPFGTIEPGQVAGERFHWDAVVDGRVVVRVGAVWLMGEENLDPAWTLGPGGQRFEVEVQGDPPAFVTIHGWHAKTIEEGLARNPGVVVASAHCVNSVPYVCAAEPGVKTYLDLPLITGRAHPDLARKPS